MCGSDNYVNIIVVQRNLKNRLNMMAASDEKAVRSYIQSAVLERVSSELYIPMHGKKAFD